MYCGIVKVRPSCGHS